MFNNMGTIQKGILGGFSGTVGTVVGASWRGIEYMRSRANRRTFTSSQKQIEQQLKFGLMTRFQQPLNGLLNETFMSYAVRMTGANSALGYNLRNAVTGTYPDYAVNYSLFLVSRGDLLNAQNPTATAGGTGLVNFAWTDNAGSGKALATDKAIVVICSPEMRQCLYSTDAADRSEEAASFDASEFVGKTVQTWIAFISESGKDVATSIYTGEVLVS
jgi:hypothetical protein